MLTKAQTLYALPILASMCAGFWLIGIVCQEILFPSNIAIVVVMGAGALISGALLIAVCLSVFLSYGTALFFYAPGSGLWEKTGNPFYYFLWKELQEATRRHPNGVSLYEPSKPVSKES